MFYHVHMLLTLLIPNCCFRLVCCVPWFYQKELWIVYLWTGKPKQLAERHKMKGEFCFQLVLRCITHHHSHRHRHASLRCTADHFHHFSYWRSQNCWGIVCHISAMSTYLLCTQTKCQVVCYMLEKLLRPLLAQPAFIFDSKAWRKLRRNYLLHIFVCCECSARHNKTENVTKAVFTYPHTCSTHEEIVWVRRVLTWGNVCKGGAESMVSISHAFWCCAGWINTHLLTVKTLHTFLQYNYLLYSQMGSHVHGLCTMGY